MTEEDEEEEEEEEINPVFYSQSSVRLLQRESSVPANTSYFRRSLKRRFSNPCVIHRQ